MCKPFSKDPQIQNSRYFKGILSPALVKFWELAFWTVRDARTRWPNAWLVSRLSNSFNKHLWYTTQWLSRKIMNCLVTLLRKSLINDEGYFQSTGDQISTFISGGAHTPATRDPKDLRYQYSLQGKISLPTHTYLLTSQHKGSPDSLKNQNCIWF